jgi:hypothetical protein
VQCPAPGPTYETYDALLVILTFPYPIRASEMRFDAHGGLLPYSDVLDLTETKAAVLFQKVPQNLVLDISIAQAAQ